MAVAAHEVGIGTQWRSLEPEGRGHELMLMWALYRRGGERTRSPVSSGSWSEPLDKAFDAEPEWCVRVDRLLGELIRKAEVYERLVQKFYLDGLAIWDVADKVHHTEGWVRLSLRGICSMVEYRLPGIDVRD